MKKILLLLALFLALQPTANVFAVQGLLPSQNEESSNFINCYSQYAGKSDEQLDKIAASTGQDAGKLKLYRDDWVFYLRVINDVESALGIFKGIDPDNPSPGEDGEVRVHTVAEKQDAIREVLACALKSGHIKFWMFQFYSIYIIEFILQIAGLLSVLMIVLGGYYYIAGGLEDDKEKGKNTIRYAIIGLVVTLSSWTVTNLILLALTS